MHSHSLDPIRKPVRAMLDATSTGPGSPALQLSCSPAESPPKASCGDKKTVSACSAPCVLAHLSKLVHYLFPLQVFLPKGIHLALSLGVSALAAAVSAHDAPTSPVLTHMSSQG